MRLIEPLRKSWPLFIILAFGATLRLWRIESLLTFSADQGTHFLEALDILKGNVTLLGPRLGAESINGNIYLGPFYYYMLAIALLIFNHNPVGPSYFVVVLSLLAILVTYITCLKFISKRTALLTSAILATSPPIVEQSRVALNPFPAPFFSSVTLFCLMEVVIAKSKKLIWPALLGTSLGILFQLHYLTVALILSVFLLLVFSRLFKALKFSVLAFLITVAPQMLFEIKHNFFIFHEITRRFGSERELTSMSALPNHILLAFKSLMSVISNLQQVYFILAVMIVLFMILARNEAKNLRLKTIILILPIGLNILFASIWAKDVQFHYFSSIYINTAILLSMAVFFLAEKLSRFVFKFTFVSVVLIVLVVNTAELDLQRAEGYTMPKGWNLKGQKLATQEIMKNQDTQSTFNVASTLDGDTRNMPIRYLLTAQRNPPLGVERYPESEAIYLISRDDETAVANYTVWEVSSFKPFEIFNMGEIQNGIYLYKLSK